MDFVELAITRGRSENVIAKYSSSGLALLKNSTIAARSVSILSLMLLLTSRSMAIESGASSFEKYRISCRLSSSKRRKSCLFKVVTGRFLESFTVTGTNTTSTSTCKGLSSGFGAGRVWVGTTPEDVLGPSWPFCGKMCTSSAYCPCAKQSGRSVKAHKTSRRIPKIRSQTRLFFMAFRRKVPTLDELSTEGCSRSMGFLPRNRRPHSCPRLDVEG